MTPLHYAASCEHEEMVQLLVRCLAGPYRYVCRGLTWHFLAQVRHGALVDIEDLDGDTPLMTASNPALQLIMADGSTSGRM